MVVHQSTCRKSFHDLPLHDLFTHYLSHVYAFQVLLRNTPRSILASIQSIFKFSAKLWNSQPQTIREADSSAVFHRQLYRHTCFLTDLNPSIRLTVHHLFFPSSFWSYHALSIYLVLLLTKSPEAHRAFSQWRHALYRNGHYHHHHHNQQIMLLMMMMMMTVHLQCAKRAPCTACLWRRVGGIYKISK